MREARDHQALLIGASERLAAARSLAEIVDVLRTTARDAVGAEGVAVVLREDGKCFYAAEDAVSPLWVGSRFDEAMCVSGWAMRHLETVAISDTRADPRVPQEAYSQTFVRSLLMAPIGRPRAVAALGAYWSDVREHDPETVRRLETLARMAAIALENARLIRSVEEASRQRALMVAAARIGLWSYDVVSGVLDTSPMCRTTFGRDPDLPFSYPEWEASLHPDDRDRVLNSLAASLETGVDYDVEYRTLTPEGVVRWVGIRAQPSHDRNGRPLTLDGLSVDISERKRMEEALRSSAATLEHLVEERTRELVAAQDALRQAQKLDAMGQLTGGVAHDFNNLLSPIIGSLDLLQRRGVGTERERRLIDGALQSADRARILVQRLLAFARRQPLKTEHVDVGALVLGMRELLSATVGSMTQLCLDAGGEQSLAMADANQLEMAILNLVVNARDAMPSGGRLAVFTRRAERGGEPFVVVTVADSGVGMDPETLGRAVEPFFSTKGVGRGTGLGLSMVHGLASQLGGDLRIESEVGRGTSVELWLPAAVEVKGRHDAPAVGRQTMAACDVGVALLVDDEELVRATTSDMLAEIGFEVIEAGSAAEALEVLRVGTHVDVLVTDHMMPQMTGVELAREVRIGWPGMPVLLASGYSDACGVDSEIPRLEKPFRQADLASMLASLMSDRMDLVGMS